MNPVADELGKSFALMQISLKAGNVFAFSKIWIREDGTSWLLHSLIKVVILLQQLANEVISTRSLVRSACKQFVTCLYFN